MKIYKFITLLGTLLNRDTIANESETRTLEKFNKVNLEGRMELHLERNSCHSMKVRTKKASNIANLVTEVREDELYIYNEKKGGNGKTPKYIIHLNHTGVSDITLSGVVRLISDDVLNQKDLTICGEGILNGNLKVSVNKLSTNISGISDISISGHADVANLKITGIGRINAKSLKTGSTEKRADGFATVLMPIN